MKIAVFPGSFDPVTIGHVDILERAAKLFDRVYICAMVNAEKRNMFTPDERLALLRGSTAHIPNVEAELWSGLLVDYAREKGAKYLVKGVRNGTDFDLEYSLSLINTSIEPELETVLLCADPAHLHISSTMAREMIRYKQDLTKCLPAFAADYIKREEV